MCGAIACVCMCVRLCVCMRVCAHINTHVRVCACVNDMHGCMYVREGEGGQRVCVGVCVCTDVCMCVCV